MKRENRKMTILVIIGGIAIIWGLLTLIAEKAGTKKSFVVGDTNDVQRALIIYDPDPFYNLDEQVCSSFAKGMAEMGWKSQVATVSSLKNMDTVHFNLYVFCANTYNWAPDWAVSNYVKNNKNLKGKNVATITLGSGSTERAKRILEDMVRQKQANLIDSRTFWLLRPNDESRSKESNVQVALEMAKDYGKQVAQSF